jgi:hypothetical protein
MDDSKRYHGNRVSKPSDAVDNEIDFINEEREALGILQGKEITKHGKDNVQRAENVSPMAEPLRTVGYQAFPPYFGIKRHFINIDSDRPSYHGIQEASKVWYPTHKDRD